MPQAFYAAVLADYVTGKIKESNSITEIIINMEKLFKKTSEMKKKQFKFIPFLVILTA